jgi:fatty-acid desaturase
MWTYRTLFLFGFIGLFSVIVDMFVNYSWQWLVPALIYNFIFNTYLGNTISLHRYLGHRSFKTTPFKHKIMCLLSMIPGHGSPIDFAIIHRHHHANSDVELDTHSPRHGFWHSWLLYGLYGANYWKNVKKVRVIPKDLARDPMVKFVHHYYYHIMFSLVVATAMIDWRISAYFVLLPIALGMWDNFYLSWVSHVSYFPGNYRNFNLPDDTHNNKYAAFMHGEFHHNHHQNPTAYNMAMAPGEFDLAALIIDKFLIEHDTGKQYKI